MSKQPPSPRQPDPDKDPRDQQKVPVRSFAVSLLMLLLLISLFMLVSQGKGQYPKIAFKPDFIDLLENGKVEELTVVNSGPGVQFLRGTLSEMEDGQQKKFQVPVLYGEYMERFLLENEALAEIKFQTQNPYLRDLLVGAVPFLLVLGLLYFLFIRQMRSAGKGAMNFGKSRAKLLNRATNKINFSDVAGAEEAKEEVMEIVDFLKDPKKFQRLGGRIPKGVMLVGPPGTGKTLLAKAIAGEADVPFFSISGSDFVEMFVGVGASRVRDMFEQGKKNAPCIIFIDEIDAVGRSRFSGIGGGHDEREQTLNALLVEMDGFDTQEGVIIVAATNRPDVLDNALMRPGRFDRQIVVDPPSLEGRAEILAIHTQKIKLSKKVDLRKVARGTPGFSGADLANLVNEAALLAARRGAKRVEMTDLEEARDKVSFGAERRSTVLDDEEKKLTAFHEAGHAIVAEVLDHCDPVHKVTIIPRGRSLGSTMYLPEKDSHTQAKKKLLDQLATIMGGRAAEELALDDITTGAYGDFSMATSLARAMVTQYGMSRDLGPQAFGSDNSEFWLGRDMARGAQYSERTAQRIDDEVHTLLTAAYTRAFEALQQHRDALDVMAAELIERETIDGNEVKEIVQFNRILTNEERKDLNPKAWEDPANAKPQATQSGSEESDKAANESPSSESGDLDGSAGSTPEPSPA